MEKNELKDFVNDLNNTMYKKEGVVLNLHNEDHIKAADAEKMNKKIAEMQDYLEKENPDLLPAVNLICQYAMWIGLHVGLNGATDDDTYQLSVLEEILGRNVPEWPDAK